MHIRTSIFITSLRNNNYFSVINTHPNYIDTHYTSIPVDAALESMYGTQKLLITSNKHFTIFYSSASIKVLILCGSCPLHLLHRTIAPKCLLFCCITIIYPSQTHTKNHLMICSLQNVFGHQRLISMTIHRLQIEKERIIFRNNEKIGKKTCNGCLQSDALI